MAKNANELENLRIMTYYQKTMITVKLFLVCIMPVMSTLLKALVQVALFFKKKIYNCNVR